MAQDGWTRVKPAGDTHRPAAPPRSGLLVLVAVVRLGQHMSTAGLGRPELPGAPGLSGIWAVAAVARVDLALPEILDLPAQLLGAQQRTRIAWQIDRHAHDLDQRTPGRGETMAPHQGNVVAGHAFRQIAS